MPERSQGITYGVVGGVVLYWVSYLAVSAPVPTPWSPYPGLQFLLISAGVPRALAAAAWPALFGVSVIPLVARPYRGRLVAVGFMLAGLLIGSVIYIVARAEEGGAHQGTGHVILMVAVNLGMLASAYVTWKKSRNSPTSPTAVLCVFTLIAWLAFAAFPYFGEGI